VTDGRDATLPADLPAEARGLSGRLDAETGVHRMWLRIYYEDTDAAGIVYHAGYLRYAERARTEMLRLLGIGQGALRDRYGIGFAVRHAELDFRAPARLDDLLEVRSYCRSFSRVQFHVSQRILNAVDRRELVRVGVRVACIDAATRPARLPRDLAQTLRPLMHPQEQD
jgi:acyl-CoA thioester hydrolase